MAETSAGSEAPGPPPPPPLPPRSSSSSRWYSPVLDAVPVWWNDDDDDDDEAANAAAAAESGSGLALGGGAVVTVPESGWYGFCVGGGAASSAADSYEHESSTNPSLVLRIREAALENAEAVAQAASDEDDGGGRQQQQQTNKAGGLVVKEHPLPFRVEEGGGTKELLSLDVGRLIYLSKDCRVQVVMPVRRRQRQQQQIQSHCNDDNDELHQQPPPAAALPGGGGAAAPSFQWQLLCHRMTGHAAAASRQSPPPVGTLAPHQEPEPNNGRGVGVVGVGCYSPKKALVCAMCAKSFGTLRAVECHVQSAHRLAAAGRHSKNNNNNHRAAAAAPAGRATAPSSSSYSPSYTSKLWTTPLPVAFDDDCVAVVVKPQGMPVMGTRNGRESLYRSDLLLALANPGAHPKKKKVNAADNADTADTSINKRKRKNRAPDDGGGDSRSSEDKQDDDDVDDEDLQSHHHQEEEENSDGATGRNSSPTTRKQDKWYRKPRPVHRLDAATGGLLVVAKSRQAERRIKRAWAQHRCHKTYLALVIGALPTPPSSSNAADGSSSSSGTCDAPLWGKVAVTRYRVVRQLPSERFGHLTVVELQPVTGRRHQLRRHLQILGHPILGDRRYTSAGGGRHQYDDRKEEEEKEKEKGEGGPPHPYSRLCLWAVGIQFPHPVSEKEITCKMEDPEWLDYVIRYEEEQWQKSEAQQRQKQEKTTS